MSNYNYHTKDKTDLQRNINLWKWCQDFLVRGTLALLKIKFAVPKGANLNI
jgi:hypothetical protein